MNQKSLEEFLGLYREDKYDGGTLIRFYYDYINSRDEKILHLLFLHNEEDLLGMLKVVEMLSFVDFFNSDFTLSDVKKNEDYLTLYYTCNEYLDYKLSIEDEIFLNASENKLILDIPILKSELKFFFEKYKDYYYLTIEDYAVHKSIGEFVDKSVKKKATKQTAYIKQVAEYIPCFNTVLVGEIFKKEYKSKEKYINLAKLDFSDKVFFREYAIEMLKQFKLLKQ